MSYSGKFKDKNNNLHPVTSVLYGTCDTAAATAAKVVTCTDFDSLMTGVTIRVKFTNANTAANPTVNINSTGAKSVYRFGTTTPVDGDSWTAGEVVELLYDGTSFFMVGADDLSVKQNVTDNNLTTTSKQVVGAVNELNSNLTSLSSKVNRGTVSVTPDGVKSFSQLFDALYALMDTSKINGLSVLQVGNAYYHCTYISTYLEFTSINHGNAANNSFTNRLAISQSGSVYTRCYFSGNFEDNSAIVPTVNEFEIVLHY